MNIHDVPSKMSNILEDIIIYILIYYVEFLNKYTQLAITVPKIYRLYRYNILI